MTHHHGLRVLHELPLHDIVGGIFSQMALVLAEIAHRDAVQEHLVEFLQRAAFHLRHAQEEEDHAGEVGACPDVAVFGALEDMVSLKHYPGKRGRERVC
jgi:hypothetical protein